MNIEGKLKSYRDLLVWQKSMALCQVAFVGLRVGKPAATGGGCRPVQYRPKDSRVTLLKDPFMPSPGRHHQEGKLFPVPRGCRGMSCREDGTGNPKDTPYTPEVVKKFKTNGDREGEVPAEPHGARTCWAAFAITRRQIKFCVG